MEFNFEESAGYYINRTAAALRNSLQKAFNRDHGDISIEYWVILNRLWSKDGWTQSDLARMTHKDNASMTRMLDGMEKKGLVKREKDDQDRRAHRVLITGKGRSLEMPLKSLAFENMTVATKGLSSEEIESMKRILDKIHNNL